jgi:hypothetical protein
MITFFDTVKSDAIAIWCRVGGLVGYSGAGWPVTQQLMKSMLDACSLVA